MPFDQDGSEMIKRPIRPDVGAKQFNAKGAIKASEMVRDTLREMYGKMGLIAYKLNIIYMVIYIRK